MLFGKKIVVVMPAYNAEPTLRRTYSEIPFEYIDEAILVDDGSSDRTVEVARELGCRTLVHLQNKGYGGNQKTCYREALRHDADVVVMLHPDYQYTPKLLVAMASMIAVGEYDVVLGSRILCQSALAGGMPVYKYISNRFLTLFENILLGQRVSEYHTGYRAFSRKVLETLPLEENSDDFVFDNQMLAQVLHFGFRMGEISCPTKYFAEASSISFKRSVKYGLGVLQTSVAYWLHHRGLAKSPLFNEGGERLLLEHRSHVQHTDAQRN
jgi:glycosyltransferase involved in cell wall biosynthesis